jgi:hypothetical protein
MVMRPSPKGEALEAFTGVPAIAGEESAMVEAAIASWSELKRRCWCVLVLWSERECEPFK